MLSSPYIFKVARSILGSYFCSYSLLCLREGECLLPFQVIFREERFLESSAGSVWFHLEVKCKVDCVGTFRLWY